MRNGWADTASARRFAVCFCVITLVAASRARCRKHLQNPVPIRIRHLRQHGRPPSKPATHETLTDGVGNPLVNTRSIGSNLPLCPARHSGAKSVDRVNSASERRRVVLLLSVHQWGGANGRGARERL